ncbi:transglutaminase-like domain-containing protein [Pseudoalteromonas sp. T1lg65]|uniref:transglutaminase-like domain-containing protein n=1 Tax=Pseudoalteromonas sp. T1lg65 TaxID=2077101 RepID=UPI003F7968BA
MQSQLIATPMVDYQTPTIQALINERQWKSLPTLKAAEQIYLFVRDEIQFGYSENDTLKASEVLKQKYGQCNTKGTLLIALFRGCGIPARLHGFKISNALKRGIIPPWLTWLAPNSIIHSWVEVYLQNQWVELEGYIIDKPYLEQVQMKFAGQTRFTGLGISTPCLKNPDVEFALTGTYIQRESITEDLGTFTQPDDFYKKYANLNVIQRFFYRSFVRKLINTRVKKMRNG